VTGGSARRGYDGVMRRGWVLALLFLCGCFSKITAHDGKFTVAYPSMVEHENFTKPIAPGAKLEVVVWANGTTEKLEIISAKSSQPDVLAIAKTKEKSIVLAGKTPGIAEIEIKAKAENGTELVDKMFFHVAKPVKHTLQHSCTEEPEAAYVVGDDVWIDHTMTTSDGRNVVGGDYLPLDISPRSALELVEQPQAGGLYWFKAKSAKTVTVRSKIDDQSITVKLLDRKDLTDARLIGSDRMLVGRSSYAVAWVSAGKIDLCSQDALTTAKSLTPDICKVTAKLDDDPDSGDSNRQQLARVQSLAFGICKYEITLPELAKGRGVTLRGEMKIGREEYPGEGGAAERVRSYLDEWSRPLGAIASAKEALALIGLALLGLRRKITRG
jgi:hypothetical protein